MSKNNVFRIEDEGYPLFDEATLPHPLTSTQAANISFKPSLNDGSFLDDNTNTNFVDQMKSMVVDMCRVVLEESSSDVMNVTELSTIVSAYVGSEITQFIQDNYDGLLFLLKNYPSIFRIQNTTVCSTISLVSRYAKKFQSQPYQISSTENLFPSNERFSQTCLHIGNVPPNMGEIQLQREFEQFGPVESVNVYTQRPRKYAFISFFSAEDASQAKFVLSKKFPWKSAISFARKENPAKLKTMYGGNTPQLQYGLGGMHNDFSPSNSTSGSSTPKSPVAYDNYGSVINSNDNTKIYEENFPVGKLLRGTSASSIGSNQSNSNNNSSYHNPRFYQGNRPNSLPRAPVGPEIGMFSQQNYKATFPGGSTRNNSQLFYNHQATSDPYISHPYESNGDFNLSITAMIDSMSGLGINNNQYRSSHGGAGSIGNEPDNDFPI